MKHKKQPKITKIAGKVIIYELTDIRSPMRVKGSAAQSALAPCNKWLLTVRNSKMQFKKEIYIDHYGKIC
jgi:hypothetical protein